MFICNLFFINLNLGKYVPPGVSKYSFDSDVATSHPQAFKHVKTLKGRTRDEGDHWVKLLFNGHIDPPAPVVIDAKVGVVDVNNQLLHVCVFTNAAERILIMDFL
jgi:hypothetical protein